ncbi:beta-lactamase [Streptococcus pneumoniae]|nr:beta-lactamase [Streptococcus pneumoniae]
MRKFLIILLLPSFLTISKVVSTEKKSSILRKKFITFHNLTLVFILEKN